jgi:hypothetical protein
MTLALQLFKNSNDTRGKLRLNFHSLNVSVSELLEYGRMTRWAFYKSTAGSLLFILVNISFGKSLVIPLDSKCSFLSIVCFGEFVANDNWQGRREGGGQGGQIAPGPEVLGAPENFLLGPSLFCVLNICPGPPPTSRRPWQLVIGSIQQQESDLGAVPLNGASRMFS